MAYTSALTICGGESMYMAENNWLSYFPIILALITTGLIARNHRGGRTYVALVMATLSTLVIVLVHQLVIPSFYYNVAAAMLFLAIWLNGSMISFVSTFVGMKRH